MKSRLQSLLPARSDEPVIVPFLPLLDNQQEGGRQEFDESSLHIQIDESSSEFEVKNEPDEETVDHTVGDVKIEDTDYEIKDEIIDNDADNGEREDVSDKSSEIITDLVTPEVIDAMGRDELLERYEKYLTVDALASIVKSKLPQSDSIIANGSEIVSHEDEAEAKLNAGKVIL